MPLPVDDRIEPLDAMSAYYDIRWHTEFGDAVWGEITAMLRTIRQLDMVKLVAVDLDDTLWSGISGEMTEVSPWMIEGWPLGLIEALLHLKKRGVLLAIISKNDETRIRRIWDEIFAGRLSLDDFAAVRINWRPKSENMREIIDIVNIMPSSVVFVDDNPVERAEMQHAFPNMRILGQNPYFLRRILLWAPETQVASISDESRRRTEMVQAQFSREAKREVVSRSEFLATAAPKVTMIRIATISHPRFERTFELLNKTNQFNTTGRRWRFEECEDLLRGGGTVWAFEVSDSFTNYGLVGVVIVRDKIIEQWAMSCRVLGYQIEEAVMAHIVDFLVDRSDAEVEGRLIKTEANFPCQDLFAKCGFEHRGDHWVLAPGMMVEAPAHVRVLEAREPSISLKGV
jgi:FkbH-like protein